MNFDEIFYNNCVISTKTSIPAKADLFLLRKKLYNTK